MSSSSVDLAKGLPPGPLNKLNARHEQGQKKDWAIVIAAGRIYGSKHKFPSNCRGHPQRPERRSDVFFGGAPWRIEIATITAPATNSPGLPGESMARSVWNGAVLAESDQTRIVEGNHYFPPDSLRMEYFRPSQTHTTCGWKGIASYYHVEVNGNVNRDAAWYYPKPLPAAAEIAGYVAFWKGVTVEECVK